MRTIVWTANKYGLSYVYYFSNSNDRYAIIGNKDLMNFYTPTKAKNKGAVAVQVYKWWLFSWIYRIMWRRCVSSFNADSCHHQWTICRDEKIRPNIALLLPSDRTIDRYTSISIAKFIQSSQSKGVHIPLRTLLHHWWIFVQQFINEEMTER